MKNKSYNNNTTNNEKLKTVIIYNKVMKNRENKSIAKYKETKTRKECKMPSLYLHEAATKNINALRRLFTNY